jgi:hypothetical protein
MHPEMSEKTRKEVMERLRRRYANAGREHKSRLVDQAVEMFGYHRKAAIRALGRQTASARTWGGVPVGRPREYDPQRLMPALKAVWFAAGQPCAVLLKAVLPAWMDAYEAEHSKLAPAFRESLLKASARTLDRMLRPVRAARLRAGGTRPGSMLRQEIPIRGRWESEESGPGWLEVDTVALCGGSLDDRHLWMLDAVDIHTGWTALRALENRSQHATLRELADLERSLPFAMRGLDCDNGGEFLNHHLRRHLLERDQPVRFTRSRPYRKNDNAHVEQRNWTHVRQHFGYERYDNPEVVALINALCRGALGRLQNHWLATLKLESKRREGSRIIRCYGPAMTPLERVLASPQVEPQVKERLRAEHAAENPFELARQIERAKLQIERIRTLKA